MTEVVEITDEMMGLAIPPEYSIREFCQDCNKPHLMIDKGYVIEPSDKYRNCMENNHNLVLQILYKGKWMEMLMPEICSHCGGIIKR